MTGLWNGIDVEYLPTTKAEFFAWVTRTLEDPENTLSLEDVLDLLGVCPAGFVDTFTASIVALESHAATYHTLPHGRGILNETARTMAAFQEVRASRDDFYSEEQKRRAAQKR